jgi:AcrR family transcriptional regulator
MGYGMNETPDKFASIASAEKPARTKSRTVRPSGRQAVKSLVTQTAILEAVIKCLIDKGYARTTMDSVAKCGKVSRGAMMHHFSSRAAVIEKAAIYLAEKRLKEFETLARAIVPPLAAGEKPQLLHMLKTMELVRTYYTVPSFAALHELLLAARTDKKLARTVRRVQTLLNDGITPIILRVFPFWVDKSPQLLTVLVDLIHFAFRGVAMSHMDDLDPDRIINLEKILAHLAHEKYTEGAPEFASILRSPGGARKRSRK